MDPITPYLLADERLSEVERLTDQAAGELEHADPRTAERVAKLRTDARAVRLDLAREARRAAA